MTSRVGARRKQSCSGSLLSQAAKKQPSGWARMLSHSCFGNVCGGLAPGTAWVLCRLLLDHKAWRRLRGRGTSPRTAVDVTCDSAALPGKSRPGSGRPTAESVAVASGGGGSRGAGKGCGWACTAGPWSPTPAVSQPSPVPLEASHSLPESGAAPPVKYERLTTRARDGRRAPARLAVSSVHQPVAPEPPLPGSALVKAKRRQ